MKSSRTGEMWVAWETLRPCLCSPSEGAATWTCEVTRVSLLQRR